MSGAAGIHIRGLLFTLCWLCFCCCRCSAGACWDGGCAYWQLACVQARVAADILAGAQGVCKVHEDDARLMRQQHALALVRRLTLVLVVGMCVTKDGPSAPMHA
jgi:hypothetical protein